MAWQGSLPVPEFARTRGHPPKKAALAADLLEIWNSSFFVPRGVELVLYKGRERRSGPFAGRVDIEIPAYGDVDDVSDSSDSSSDSSGLSDDGYGANIYGVYGRQPPAQMSEAAEARRRRHEKKAEKKRRKREKKIRRKAREREKKYALYLTCVRQGGAVGNGAIGGISGGLRHCRQYGWRIQWDRRNAGRSECWTRRDIRCTRLGHRRRRRSPRWGRRCIWNGRNAGRPRQASWRIWRDA